MNKTFIDRRRQFRNLARELNKKADKFVIVDVSGAFVSASFEDEMVDALERAFTNTTDPRDDIIRELCEALEVAREFAVTERDRRMFGNSRADKDPYVIEANEAIEKILAALRRARGLA